MTGRIRPPAGVARAEVCRNRVTVTARAGGRQVARQRAAVRPNCRFRVVVNIRNRARMGRAASLTITIAKPGATLSTRRASPLRLRVFVR